MSADGFYFVSCALCGLPVFNGWGGQQAAWWEDLAKHSWLTHSGKPVMPMISPAGTPAPH